MSKEEKYKTALQRIANLDGKAYYMGTDGAYYTNNSYSQAVKKIDITVEDLARIAKEALEVEE